MQILKQVAAKQKTVMLTIHQPSSGIFKQFDKMMLLAPGGKLVYHGAPYEAKQHFSTLGHFVPPEWIPTDFYLDLISNEEIALQLVQAAAAIKDADGVCPPTPPQ